MSSGSLSAIPACAVSILLMRLTDRPLPRSESDPDPDESDESAL
eukprot:CAMPEP_0181383426 /NCGR_PEP_ID=MMETSP1106-20121128/21345_1 /TAXON_ID=81844 /ORGANISM="Mantoniella antarctica, Strain SL-175" /LENGTH=43 /DNA_ID= /DNA_START= /DNA_END= /DNA_ORIENTATION=